MVLMGGIVYLMWRESACVHLGIPEKKIGPIIGQGPKQLLSREELVIRVGSVTIFDRLKLRQRSTKLFYSLWEEPGRYQYIVG